MPKDAKKDLMDGVPKPEKRRKPDIGTPSPLKKKDMHLRSGKRKRRRSKETSGLTPPEKQKKRRETEEVTKSKVLGEVVAPTQGAEESQLPAKQTTVTFEDVEEPKAGRTSMLETDAKALASAQYAEQEIGDRDDSDDDDEDESEEADGEDDSNRQLFDKKPPSITLAPPKADEETPADEPKSDELNEKPASTTEGVAQSTVQEVPVAAAPPERVEPQQETEAEPEAEPERGSQPEEVDDFVLKFPFWLVFFVWGINFFPRVWPVCLDWADWALPLLRDPPQIPELQIDTTTPIEVGEPVMPSSVSDSIKALEELLDDTTTMRASLLEEGDNLSNQIDHLIAEMSNGEFEMEHLDSHLNAVYAQLMSVFEYDDNPLSQNWEAARRSVRSVGLTLLDTTAVEIWPVAGPRACPTVITKIEDKDDDDDEVESDPAIDASDLEEEVKELVEEAQESARMVMASPRAADNVRKWVQTQIDGALGGNEDAISAITYLVSSDSKAQEPEKDTQNGIENIEELLRDRLEKERADRTGEFDHASALNGAKVIYEGSRGTSKSLVDSLPVMNRLLQLSQLRFYGFGPEAAITPTYPPNALGQCWSFKPTPLEEILKRRRSGKDVGRGVDHKLGNYGTLTISFSLPVYVQSVVIEHPPKGVTDQASSAIRAFRIIGYEDDLAEGKGWALGAFEYDIENEHSLQEFEMQTESFGKAVPPLHSITLAVDSNWGLDYSCLYRFRVHGEHEQDEEDDEY